MRQERINWFTKENNSNFLVANRQFTVEGEHDTPALILTDLLFFFTYNKSEENFSKKIWRK